MNIFQKITALITAICILVTLGILFVFFTMPFSEILLTEICAILFAELVLGISGIWLYGKDDREFPYTLSVWLPGILYFLFVLIMIYPASQTPVFHKFIMTHVIGCAVLAISHLVFLLGKHGIRQTETVLTENRQNKTVLIQEMQEIQLLFAAKHPSEKEIRNAGEKFLEELHFASVPVNSPSGYDTQIFVQLQELKVLANVSSVEEYRKKLQDINQLFLLRERK